MAKEDVERGRRERDRGDAHGEISDVQSTSWVIPAVVISNVVVFVVVMYVNDCPGKSHRCLAKFLGRFSFESFKENPLLGPSSSTLIKMGALAWWKVVQEHQGWRLVTCMWLHAGVIHLVANMLCVAFIGVRLEQQFGFVRIGTIYLVSGFCGSILSSLFLQHSISVGASGALFGLLGAMLSELLINWTIYVNKVAALIMLLVIVGVNLALGTLPRVDNFAHIGGFLGGFLLGFVLLMRPQFEWEANQQTFRPGSRVQSKYNLCQCMLCLVAAILFAAGFAFGLVMLFRGVNLNSYCKWCYKLTCVSKSRLKC